MSPASLADPRRDALAPAMSLNASGRPIRTRTLRAVPTVVFASLRMPALRAAAPARVVVLGAIGHRLADVDLDDFNFERAAYESGMPTDARRRPACSSPWA